MNKDLNMDNVLAEHPVVESLLAGSAIHSQKAGYGVVQGCVKRVFDVVCASMGLIVLSPVFLVVAIIIKLDSKGPVFFRHERVGQHEKLFKIHKFRSMYVEQKPSDLHITIANDPRITRAGHWLRKWKIDELPQLIDVLYGRMSLVGPRPLVPEQVQHFPEQDKRIIFSLRPGITDLASISFHDENKLYENREDCEQIFKKKILPEKRKLQIQYVQSYSFLLDMKIIFKTIGVVLFKKPR